MLDVIGLNYYFHNQWHYPSRRKIPVGHEVYRPLHEILELGWFDIESMPEHMSGAQKKLIEERLAMSKKL